MPKLVFELDTDNKTASITINGKVIKGAQDFAGHIYYDDKGKVTGMDTNFELTEIVDNVLRRTTYYAYGSQNIDNVKADASAVYNDSVPECIGIPSLKNISEDICKFLGK